MSIRKLSDTQLASIGTTKVLYVTTSETLFQISSGNRAFEATNLTATTLYYGQSNLVANSGGIILQNGSKFWENIVDDFQMYFRLNTAGLSGCLIIQEYKGNQ